MTVPTNTPRGLYDPKGDTPPVVPWLGVAAAPPAIPKLYWDAYSDEQRIKALWSCFNGLADRVNQLGYYYLPDFQGEWNRVKEYPPLSVVEAPEGIEGVTAGDSYTALDWVPVGTPLTNTTYWALTGNYNAQVEAYRKLAEEAHQTAESAQSSANSAQQTADDAQSAANTAQSAAETAQSGVDSLNAMGKVLIIGDSYGDPDFIGDTNWVTYFSRNVPNKGVNNLSARGAGVVQTGHEGTNFNDIANNAIQTITDKDSYTCIIIYGGYNDMRTLVSVTTVKETLANMLRNLRTAFPNAQIHCVACNASKNWGVTLYQQYEAAWNSACKANGYAICHSQAGTWLFAPDYYDEDEIHPNATGSQIIGYNIACCVTGAAINATSTSLSNVTGATGKNTGGQFVKVNPGMYMFTGTTVTSSTTGTDFTIGKVSTVAIPLRYNYPFMIMQGPTQYMGYIDSGTGNLKCVTGGSSVTLNNAIIPAFFIPVSSTFIY